jgi:hypothetical protein
VGGGGESLQGAPLSPIGWLESYMILRCMATPVYIASQIRVKPGDECCYRLEAS